MPSRRHHSRPDFMSLRDVADCEIFCRRMMQAALFAVLLALVSCGIFKDPDRTLTAQVDQLKADLAKAKSVPANAQTFRFIYESDRPDAPPVNVLAEAAKGLPGAGHTLSGLVQDAQGLSPSVVVPVTKKP